TRLRPPHPPLFPYTTLFRSDRESDNFTAELLLKQIGAANGATGTTATGAALVRTTLAEAGIPLAGVRIVDGSGLSSLDRLTARRSEEHTSELQSLAYLVCRL